MRAHRHMTPSSAHPQTFSRRTTRATRGAEIYRSYRCFLDEQQQPAVVSSGLENFGRDILGHRRVAPSPHGPRVARGLGARARSCRPPRDVRVRGRRGTTCIARRASRGSPPLPSSLRGAPRSGTCTSTTTRPSTPSTGSATTGPRSWRLRPWRPASATRDELVRLTLPPQVVRTPIPTPKPVTPAPTPKVTPAPTPKVTPARLGVGLTDSALPRRAPFEVMLLRRASREDRELIQD